MSVSSSRAVRARKRHPCDWCGEAIEIGERYMTYTWFEYGVQQVKLHPECREASERLPPMEDEWTIGEFNRGCCCENGRCKCKKDTQEAHGKD